MYTLSPLFTYVLISRSGHSRLNQIFSPLYRKLGLKPGWLQAVTGIRERRFWCLGNEAFRCGGDGCGKGIERIRMYSKSQVGALVSCSVCKDYIEPSVAAIVHGKLGLPTTAHNYDVGNACLGFLSGITVIADQIELGRIDVGIVVAGESSREPTEATINDCKTQRLVCKSLKTIWQR